MTTKPMLGDWELPQIEYISTQEERAIVELPIPGRAGSILQDMNNKPTHIYIAGSLYDEVAANDFLQTIRDKYQTGQPLTFVADIVTATQILHVIIEKLNFAESNQYPGQVSYEILLKESPPPASSSVNIIDEDILAQANTLLDSVTSAQSLIEAAGSIPDLVDVTPPLMGVLTEVKPIISDLGNSLNPIYTALTGEQT
jgi:hypothetical protein